MNEEQIKKILEGVNPPSKEQAKSISDDCRKALDNKGLMWTIERLQISVGKSYFETGDEKDRYKWLAYEELKSVLKSYAKYKS